MVAEKLLHGPRRVEWVQIPGPGLEPFAAVEFLLTSGVVGRKLGRPVGGTWRALVAMGL